jgi:hypothetical protein
MKRTSILSLCRIIRQRCYRKRCNKRDVETWILGKEVYTKALTVSVRVFHLCHTNRKLRQYIVVAHGMVLGRGEAKSVHTANRLACSMALETLRRDGDIFGTVCDCNGAGSKAGKEKVI